MPKILMNVQKPHIYGSKRRKPGEQYEADGETHARLMVALGNASRAPVVEPTAAAPAEPTGTYRRRDQVAEAPQPLARKTAPAKKSKSFLRRRDDAGSFE
jgi:hypothetical protein